MGGFGPGTGWGFRSGGASVQAVSRGRSLGCIHPLRPTAQDGRVGWRTGVDPYGGGSEQATAQYRGDVQTCQLCSTSTTVAAPPSRDPRLFFTSRRRRITTPSHPWPNRGDGSCRCAPRQARIRTAFSSPGDRFLPGPLLLSVPDQPAARPARCVSGRLRCTLKQRSYQTHGEVRQGSTVSAAGHTVHPPGRSNRERDTGTGGDRRRSWGRGPLPAGGCSAAGRPRRRTQGGVQLGPTRNPVRSTRCRGAGWADRPTEFVAASAR